MLAEMLVGLEGSTAILESSGFVLITATGASLQPGLSCTDEYIKSAVKQVGSIRIELRLACAYHWVCVSQVAADSGYTFSEVEYTGLGFDVVRAQPMSAIETMSVSETYSGTLSVASLGRDQLYSDYEDLLSIGLASVLIATLVLGMLISKMVQKVEMLPLQQEQQYKEVQSNLVSHLVAKWCYFRCKIKSSERLGSHIWQQSKFHYRRTSQVSRNA